MKFTLVKAKQITSAALLAKSFNQNCLLMTWHTFDNDLFSPLINLCQLVVHHALLAHQVHLHHPAAAQAHHHHQAVQAGQTVMNPYTMCITHSQHYAPN